MQEKTKNALLVGVIATLAILGLVLLLLYAPSKQTGKGYTALRTLTRESIPETGSMPVTLPEYVFSASESILRNTHT